MELRLCVAQGRKLRNLVHGVEPRFARLIRDRLQLVAMGRSFFVWPGEHDSGRAILSAGVSSVEV